MKPLVLATLVLAALWTTAALCDGTEAEYGVTLISGFDSNPLQVWEKGDGSGAYFGQLRIDGQVSRAVIPAVTLFAGGDARGRFHQQAASGADVESAAVRAGFAFAPQRLPKLTFGVGGEYSAYRTTYTDRVTGDPYQVSSDLDSGAPSTVEIGDRLDHDAAQLFFNLRWKQNRRFGLFLDTTFENTHYVEDYAGTTALEPLDFHSVTVEPGASVRVHEMATLILSVAQTDLDYTEQSALDATGQRIEGELRAYAYTEYRLTVRITPAERWKLWVGARSSDRSDVYAGYYDYGAVSSYFSVDRALGTRGSLRLYGSVSDLRYDNATVSGEVDGQTLDNHVRTVLTRYERELRGGLGWFAEGGARRVDSRDPVFTYDSDWFLGGVQFRR